MCLIYKELQGNVRGNGSQVARINKYAAAPNAPVLSALRVHAPDLAPYWMRPSGLYEARQCTNTIPCTLPGKQVAIVPWRAVVLLHGHAVLCRFGHQSDFPTYLGQYRLTSFRASFLVTFGVYHTIALLGSAKHRDARYPVDQHMSARWPYLYAASTNTHATPASRRSRRCYTQGGQTSANLHRPIRVRPRT